jgi:hypothetical protein
MGEQGIGTLNFVVRSYFRLEPRWLMLSGRARERT